jgi:hypothetical protein
MEAKSGTQKPPIPQKILNNKKINSNDKQDKKDQLDKELILAEQEYDALFETINKRRADYLEQEFKKKNKE